jgi:hypothetical protein
MSGAAVRDALLGRLVDALQEDERITAAVLVGSGAVGFSDEESDLDVAAVIGGAHDAAAVYQDWEHRLQERILRVAARVRFEPARGYDSAGRFADDLPPDLLASMAATAVPMEHAALTRALRLATGQLLAEVRELYRRCGAAFPEAFATALVAQLD